MTRGVGAAAIVAVLCLSAAVARAGDAACPADPGPWLRVAFDGDGLSPAIRGRVLQQLGADLAAHGIATCETTAPGTPLGDVRVTVTRPASLAIELRDDVTQKNVSRSLSLAAVPPDARGLSIALAVEELLHASWIEAALAPPPMPAPAPVPTPVPPVVVASNRVELARAPRPPSGYAAVVGAVDHATGGLTGVGGDVRVTWGGERFSFGVTAGARGSPDTTSAHGSIREQELRLGVLGAFAFVPRSDPWGLELVARLDGFDLQLQGIAAPGARASSGSALGVLASGGVGGWAHLAGPVRLVADAVAGGSLHGVSASDAGQTSSGLSGLVIGGDLGVAVGF